MINILEISNWNQLTSARSEGYDNLRIVVTQYNSEGMIGTKISIVDKDTNDVYLCLFPQVTQSTVIPLTVSLPDEEIIQIINSYGFNVRISYPTVLPEKVVTILTGLYSAGYRYVYKDYPKYKNHPPYVIYASNQIRKRDDGFIVTTIPDYIEDEWKWCIPFKTYPIGNLIENGTVNNGLPI